MKSHALYELNGAIDDDQLRNLLCFVQNDLPNKCQLLEVRICSSGGSVSLGLAIAELLMQLPVRVRTVNLSRVDSSAVVVYAAGDERLCYASSGFFVHEVGKECNGTKTLRDLRQMIREIKFDTERVVSFLGKRTGASPLVWRKLMGGGTVLSAMQAKELALVTKIIDNA